MPQVSSSRPLALPRPVTYLFTTSSETWPQVRAAGGETMLQVMLPHRRDTAMDRQGHHRRRRRRLLALYPARWGQRAGAA